MGSKTYEGAWGLEGLLVYVVEDHQLGGTRASRLCPRTDLMKHTPTGAFECGFKGSGPSQLALAILADHLVNDGEAVDLHLGFRDRVIINLPRDRGWNLTKADIDGHLELLRASTAPAETIAAARS